MPARIFVVEDNAANLKLMAYLLRAFGHTVLTAMDGEQALAALPKEPVDLVICDVQLPRLDGYQVVQRAKQSADLRSIPIIAVTALAMVGDREKMLAAGFDGYISKPIMPQTFVPQVQAFLPQEMHGRLNAAPRPAPAPAAAPPLEGRTCVLVVDDVASNLAVLRNTLEPSGFRVMVARGVREAFALMQTSLPDLILSDIHMPDQDGYDFIRAVKADDRLKNIPFVFISSSVYKEQEPVAAFVQGADHYIRRPVGPQALLAAIQACLARRKES